MYSSDRIKTSIRIVKHYDKTSIRIVKHYDKTSIRIVKHYDKTSGLGTVNCIIFYIYLRRKKIRLIFFRHFVEHPTNIFRWSTVIGILLRHEQRLRETSKNDYSSVHGWLQSPMQSSLSHAELSFSSLLLSRPLLMSQT